MSPGNPFILASRSQRSRSRVTKTLPAWVFSLLWVLASLVFILNLITAVGSQWPYEIHMPFNKKHMFQRNIQAVRPCKSTAVVLGVLMMKGLSKNSFCLSSSHSASDCYTQTTIKSAAESQTVHTCPESQRTSLQKLHFLTYQYSIYLLI